MKLTTLTEHSDYLETLPISDAEKWQLHCKRKNFGKQPLTIGMFVPTDENGEVIEKPDWGNSKNQRDFQDKMEIYNKAKERVLFEGFKYKDGKIGFPSLYHSTDRFYDLYIKDRVVEDLLGEMFEHTLTPTAIKQIF